MRLLFPDWYTATPPELSGSSGRPVTFTLPSKATSIAMSAPVPYAPPAGEAEAPVADAGDSRMSWTPLSLREATAAYARPSR